MFPSVSIIKHDFAETQIKQTNEAPPHVELRNSQREEAPQIEMPQVEEAPEPQQEHIEYDEPAEHIEQEPEVKEEAPKPQQEKKVQVPVLHTPLRFTGSGGFSSSAAQDGMRARKAPLVGFAAVAAIGIFSLFV